jgi:acyl carrier protein
MNSIAWCNMQSTEVQNIVFSAIREINSQIPPEQRLSSSREAILLGAGGTLDSLGVVNLIVAVEEKIDATFGKSISLANEEYLVAESSPFRTIGGLVDHVSMILMKSK